MPHHGIMERGTKPRPSPGRYPFSAAHQQNWDSGRIIGSNGPPAIGSFVRTLATSNLDVPSPRELRFGLAAHSAAVICFSSHISSLQIQ